VPTKCPYPEPAQSSPYPTSHFLERLIRQLNTVLISARRLSLSWASSICSQVPATCPYTEPAQSAHKCPPPVPILSQLNLLTSARHLSLSWASSICSQVPATCPYPEPAQSAHKCPPPVPIFTSCRVMKIFRNLQEARLHLRTIQN